MGFTIDDTPDNCNDNIILGSDYNINTDTSPEVFDDCSIDDFISNLNDWD